MSEMRVPDGWSITQLGDVVDKIEGGGTPSRNQDSYWDGVIPWATVKDLTNTHLTTTEESISQKGLDESSTRLIPANTVIIATRMAVGKSVVFDKDVAINQDLKAVFPKKSVDSKFLHHWFISQSNVIDALGTGSTVKGVRLEQLRSLTFNQPSLPEQQKIASILNSVDDVIEKTQSQINKLQDLKKGTMNELLTRGIGHTEFVDSPVGKIPKGWEVKSIGQLAKVKRGASPRPIQDPKWWGGTVGWTRISDVTSSTKYLNRTRDYLSQEGVKKSVQIPQGEVILSICATIGRPIIVNTDVCIHDGFVWFDGLSEKIDREFYYYFLSYKEESLSSNRQTGTQGNLNTDIVSRLEIPVPSLSEQQNIASILTSIDRNIEDKQRKLEQTKYLKKSLMQDLLTGKVRVPLQ